MDGFRFDAIAKALVVSASRRRTLGTLLAGGLAAVGLTDPEDAWAAKSGKCTKDCGPCERCQKGQCSRNNKGKRRCKKGKCVRRSTGAPCTSNSVTGTCQSDGRCCRNVTEVCSDACPGASPSIACTACCSGTCNGGTGLCL
jgi:hypothetical protein